MSADTIGAWLSQLGTLDTYLIVLSVAAVLAAVFIFAKSMHRAFVLFRNWIRRKLDPPVDLNPDGDLAPIEYEPSADPDSDDDDSESEVR